jgi:AraC-like DNA-binding protein
MVQLEQPAMQTKEWTRLSHDPGLDVGLLHAFYVEHAYPRHSHDYYVLSLIERGRQTFTHRGEKLRTPPGGLILINPGAVHTGEPADARGFELRSLYPTVAHMQLAVQELTGRPQGLPFFREARIDHPRARQDLLSLHRALLGEAGSLEREARFVWTLARLIQRFADIRLREPRLGREPEAVRRTRVYIEENFARGIRLDELARHVSLSPYYLLRAFRAETGMPPYAYLESVRVRAAQTLIRSGHPLAQVAFECGYSSQAHMTNRFKKILGVTPGQYAGQTGFR